MFIAAKLEEIYPPKLSEFSYVTDGACTDDEILIEELLMLKVGINTLFMQTNVHMMIHPSHDNHTHNTAYPSHTTLLTNPHYETLHPRVTPPITPFP